MPGHFPLIEADDGDELLQQFMGERSRQNQSISANQTEYGDKVQIWKENEHLLRVLLKEDYRCACCIHFLKSKCEILLGKIGCSVVRCEYCKECGNELAICKPNLDVLGRIAPNHPQILLSRKRLNPAKAKMAQVTLPLSNNANLTSSTNQRDGSRTGSTSVMNERDGSTSSSVPTVLSTNHTTETELTSISSPAIATTINCHLRNETTLSSLCNRISDLEELLNTQTDAEGKVTHALILIGAVKRDFFPSRNQ